MSEAVVDLEQWRVHVESRRKLGWRRLLESSKQEESGSEVEASVQSYDENRASGT